MNLEQAKQALREVFLRDPDLTPHLESIPGQGKSTLVKDLSKEQAALHGMEWYEGPENFDPNKYGFIDMRINQLEPSDLTGMFVPVDGVFQYARSPWIPKDGQGILFIDEIRQGSPAMIAYMSQLMLDKRVGAHKLGDGWKIVSASNSVNDRAAARRLPTHMANRMIHLPIQFSKKVFIKYLHSINAPEVAISFVDWKEDYFSSFDPNKEINFTPRSYVAGIQFLDSPVELRQSLVEGAIGAGPASEFLGYADIWQDLPKFEDIVKDPKTAKVPDRADVQFATASMLSFRVDGNSFPTMLTYLNRLPSQEYQTMFVKSALARKPELAHSPTFSKFLEDNIDVLV